jgi:hypothetical protein
LSAAAGKKGNEQEAAADADPLRLLAHMRRRKRLGIARAYFIEFNGKPTQSVKTAFCEKS